MLPGLNRIQLPGFECQVHFLQAGDLGQVSSVSSSIEKGFSWYLPHHVGARTESTQMEGLREMPGAW